MSIAHELRAQFPFYAPKAPPDHYLDNAATSQIHRQALDAMVRQETSRANVQRSPHRLAEAATLAYGQARERAGRFLNAASADEVVFTSGATAALNLVACCFGSTLKPGDEVVLSAAEHHSNFVPWLRLRDRAGIRLRVLPVLPNGRIATASLADLVTERCRLIALTHCSNVTGAVSDVKAAVAAARAVGARVLLDGAQRVQHGPVDVQALGADFYAFSGHKCFGPTGVGVLWARRAVLDALPPFLTGGGMVGTVSLEELSFAPPPARFEAGTPPIAQAVGLGAALDWMMTLPWAEIHDYESALLARLLEGLARLPAVRLIGPGDLDARLPIVSFEVAGVHPHDVCQVLGERGVALRGGHHCAQPLFAALGSEGATRASIALYNDFADVDALLAGLEHALRVLS
ncbi:MAG TPA: aminotransferase class V-fold PLP-dependent enzyme [Rhodocyclaceae bacterium]|nr:aminotransferase class V-fold PLP-dependent enzyme [Rhodocyclaceae bacterium]